MRKNYPFWSNFSYLFLNKIGGIKLGELLVRSVMNVRKFKKTDYLFKKAKKILLGKLDPNKYLVGYEDSTRIEKVNGVIMGHIHHNNFKIINTKEDTKFYVNCGSWRPVVERIKGRIFQRKAELFYALLSFNGDIEITTGTINKLKKREVIS
ncbi:hypothetical protein [Thermosipho ferrireducens]|uniref:hypothetical protein n=1 Tax=Thermosipho ferrireducens TaxID=2571116 RepID=UPI002B1BDA34|nr:hypothetical protein [Thermosipho ferrireducens]